MRWKCSISLAAAVFGFGCASQTLPPSAEAAADATTQPVIPKPMVIRYAGYLNPAVLRPEQLAEVQARAAATCPVGQEVWFTLVLSNYESEGKWHYSGRIFFTPDQSSPRLRRGRCALSSDETAMMLRAGWPDPGLRQYAQVSQAGQPFGVGLDVPSGPTLPFNPPDETTDADLVAVIDEARNVIGRPRLSDDGEYHGTFEDRLLPVCRFRLIADAIHVEFGWQVGPLAGSGVFVKVRRLGNGFRADPAVGLWRS